MWRSAGVKSTGPQLADAAETIRRWRRYVLSRQLTDPAGWELQNMLTACYLIATAAYTRTESRGAHHRLDYPNRDDVHWRMHLLWRRPMETPTPEPID